MYQVELQNNEFLRQFETIVNGSLARIEYAEQERKFSSPKSLSQEMLMILNLKRVSSKVF